MPTKDQQTDLQTNKSDRVINSVWIANCKLWEEYSPDDGSLKSAIDWYNYSANNNIIERMPDPRKQTQFIEECYRHRNGIMIFTKAQNRLVTEYEELHADAKLMAQVYKSMGKKRKYGV